MKRLSFVAAAMLVVTPSWSQSHDGYCEAEREFVSGWVESAHSTSTLLPISADQLETWWATIERGLDQRRVTEANRRLGFNYYGRQIGDWEQAISFLESAMSSEPSNPKVLEDLGRALVIVGRSSEGLSILHQANTKNARRFTDAFNRAAQQCG